MTSRYGVEPGRLKGQKDIVEFVRDVVDKVSTGETSLQAGHTSVEDGNLTIRNGDLIVSESDDSIVLRLVHGSVPEIRLFPLGESDTHRIALFGQDFGFGGVPDQCVILTVETTDATQDGGKLLLTRNFAILSHQPDVGEESFIWLNVSASPLQEFYFRGAWGNELQIDGNVGLYAGSVAVGAGFGSVVISYAATFATTAAPVVALVNTGGTVTWNLTAMSTSSFTVAWTGTAAKTINFWVPRLSS